MLQSTGIRGALAVALPLALSGVPLSGVPAQAGGWGHGGGYGPGWGGGWHGGWHGGWRGGSSFSFGLSLPLTFGYPAPWPYPYPYAYPPPAVVVAPAPLAAVPASPTRLTPDGRYCREFRMHGVVNGQTMPLHGTACLEPDGSWRVVP